MEECLLHGRLHATIYEVDHLHAEGGRSGFLGSVLSFVSLSFISCLEIQQQKVSFNLSLMFCF
jgi:hypothetical protein